MVAEALSCILILLQLCTSLANHFLQGLDSCLKHCRCWNYHHRLLPSLVLHPIQRRALAINDMGRLVVHTTRHQCGNSSSSLQRTSHTDPRSSRTNHHHRRLSPSPSTSLLIRRSPSPCTSHHICRSTPTCASHHPRPDHCHSGRKLHPNPICLNYALHGCRSAAEARRRSPRWPHRSYRSRISLIYF
jgi:hypothetical protein